MNNETKKHAILGILGVSGVSALAWMFLIKPALVNANELEETERSHQSTIAQYNSFKSASNELPIAEVAEALDRAALVVSNAVLVSDIGTSLHNTLNSIANEQGMTITRIESTGAREYYQAIEDSEEGVSAQSHSVRLECEGTYSSGVRFIEAMKDADSVMRCRTFRFVPSGPGMVRVSLEIDSYAFTHVPGLSAADPEVMP